MKESMQKNMDFDLFLLKRELKTILKQKLFYFASIIFVVFSAFLYFDSSHINHECLEFSKRYIWQFSNFHYKNSVVKVFCIGFAFCSNLDFYLACSFLHKRFRWRKFLNSFYRIFRNFPLWMLRNFPLYLYFFIFSKQTFGFFCSGYNSCHYK